MERGSRKRSSSAGSEKIETVGGRYDKMEGHCSTGQSPQWAVVPMEGDEYSSYLTENNVSIRKTNWRMVYRGTIAVYCKTHTLTHKCPVRVEFKSFQC
jgi:hypothetical protein